MNNKRNKFFKAIEMDDRELIERYLRQGFNINTMNKYCYKGLDMAIAFDNTELVQFFLKNGADVNDDALYVAAKHGRVEIAKLLISYGADVNDLALIGAACFDEVEMIKLLISLGADVNQTDYSGRTALHWAAQENCLEAVQILLQNGANVNLQEEENRQTPLYISCGEGNYQVAEMLLNHNAIVDLSSESGTTPFAIASGMHYDIASLLLKHGANVNAKDTEGRTPLFYALVRHDDKEIAFLRENGANDNIVDTYGISIKDLHNSVLRKKLYDDLYGPQGEEDD